MANVATLRLGIDATGATAGAGKFVGATRTVQGAADKTKRSMMGLKGIMATVFAGAALTQGIRSATRTIVGYEQTMATVKAVTRATREEFELLSETARRMGATTRFSAQEAGEGLLNLSRAGFSAVQATEALPSVLNLAVAGAIGLAEASNFTANSIKQFSLEAEEATRVTDSFLIVSNRTNTDVTQLAEAMNYAGTVSAAFGNSVEITSAALGVLADRGLKSSRAGTALRGSLAALADVTDKGQGVLKKLGIAYDEINPEKHNLIEIFERFGQANLSASEAVGLFGRRNAAAALILSAQAGQLKSLTKAQEENRGEAERMAKAMDDTLFGALKGLKSAWEELMLTIGDSGFAGALRTVVDVITGAIRILAGMEEAVTKNVMAARVLAETIKFLALTLGAFAALKLGMFFISLAGSILKATVATRAFTLALMSNPFGMIAVAIATVITLLVQFWDTLIDVGDKQVSIGDVIVSAWEYIRDNIKVVIEYIGIITTGMWEGMKTAASSSWKVISTTATNFLNSLGIDWDKVLKGILDLVKMFTNAVIALFVGMWNTIKAVAMRIWGMVAAFGDFDISSPFASAAKVADNLKRAFEDIKNLPGEIGQIWKDAFNKDYVAQVIDFGETLAKAVGTTWEQVTKEQWFKELIEAPGRAADDILERANKRRLARTGKPAGAGDPTMPDIIDKGIDVDKLQKELDLLKNANTEVDHLDNALGTLADTGNDFGRVIGDAVGDAITNFKDLGNVIKGVWQDITRMMTTSFISNPLKDFVGGFLKGLAPSGSDGAAGANDKALGDVFTGPVTFYDRGRKGRAGEAGDEVLLPLRRGQDGRLGVAGGGSNVSVTIVTPDADSFRKNRRQVARTISRMTRGR